MSVAWAMQAGGPPGAPGRSADYLRRLEQAAQTLGERHGAVVAVDPGISLRLPPRPPEAGAGLEPGLAALAAPHRDVGVRRVVTAERGPALSAEALGAAARAIDRLQPEKLLVEDPHGKEIVRARGLSGERRPGPGEAGGYLLYSRSATLDGLSDAERFRDLERQQLATALPPGRQTLAMGHVVQLMQALGKERIERLMTPAAVAGMRLWESSPPEQRQATIEQFMELATQPGVLPLGPAAENPGPVAPPTAGVPVRSLRTLAANLSRETGEKVVVDPDLFLEQIPVREQGTALDAYLDRLVAQGGCAWRRVYVTAESRAHLPPDERLVETVRTLDAWSRGNLRVIDPAAHRTQEVRRDPAKGGVAPYLEEDGLDAKPLYVLFSLSPGARGASADARLADLQQRQLDAMLRMGPDELAPAFERTLRAFQEAAPADRTRVMALPGMAVLMATWMPRAAKERSP